jgi:signal transduction histidine kinase
MTALGILFATISILGAVFSLVVLKADRRRWDNRVFATMGMLDATSNGSRALSLLGGRELTHPHTLQVCAILAFPMTWACLEFAYSFPFNRPAPMRLRIPLLGVTAITLGLQAWIGRAGGLVHQPKSELLQTVFYFAPLFVVMVVLLSRNLRRAVVDRTSVLLVGSFLVIRWFSSLVVYGIAQPFLPEEFPAFVFADATIVLIVTYLLMTFALMRNQLFSVRGFAVDMLVLATSAFGVIALSAFAIEGALRVADGKPLALRATLILASFIPLVVAVVGTRLRRGFERAVTRNIDPRRVLREEVLERARSEETRDPEPRTLMQVVREALSDLTNGGDVVFLSSTGTIAPRLPNALAAQLAASATGELARVASPDLGYDLVVAVRSASAHHGAIAITGGKIDRDTHLAARSLADRLALKLDTYALFIELEASRRLATLGAFAAAIAHDIRTPLTSVQMNVQILRRKVSLPPDEMEYFDIALEELKRLNASIQELLDFAKPAQVETSAVDLEGVIADARRATESALAELGIVLGVEIDTATPPARGDAQRLRNVLENLITNAANASSKGGKIEVRTRRADDASRVVVEVVDHGHGIAAADLPRIFEPFFTTRADGTGLGLAICDKLIRAQNGEIRVDSTPKEGTTFSVLLPAFSDEPEEASDRSVRDRRRSAERLVTPT